MTNGNEIAAAQGRALQAAPSSGVPMMSIADLKTRAGMVQRLKREIMVDGVHMGTIPGCGDKPTLLKNGAELLCMAFRLAPDTKVEITDLGEGHREYMVTTTISSQVTGEIIATGIGSCSTKESKYRYRGTERENTGKPVPKEYWSAKKAGSPTAQGILGGPGFVAAKDENGNWTIFKKGSTKLENPDIADTYNTVLKMASKRSLIDAVLKATGGSCAFTQDLEDMKGNAAAGGYDLGEDGRQGYGRQQARQASPQEPEWTPQYEDADYAEQEPAPQPEQAEIPLPEATELPKPRKPAAQSNLVRLANFLAWIERQKAVKGADAVADCLGRLGFESEKDVKAADLKKVSDAVAALPNATEAQG
jgi:hypothetical protein